MRPGCFRRQREFTNPEKVEALEPGFGVDGQVLVWLCVAGESGPPATSTLEWGSCLLPGDPAVRSQGRQPLQAPP